MSMSGRGVTPAFNPSKYRGAPPELVELVQQTLGAPVEGEVVEGGKTEYVATAENLDSFVVRKGGAAAKILSFETVHESNLLVNWVNTEGKKETSELSGNLLELVQKRNRALTQLEIFLQEQIEKGSTKSEQKNKLSEILQNVSQYQSNLMRSIDHELKLSEKVVRSSS